MADRWEELEKRCQDCRECSLCETRTNVVFGDGSRTAEIMFVGEGPGAHEDEQGVPFVGKAGQLLDDMLAIIGLDRTMVYIANIVKCRPKNNRTPTLEEGRHCADIHLVKEIELVQPKVIVCLGKVAFQYFYGRAASIMRNRGKWFTWRGYDIMPTYHPAFLLRQTGHELVESKWQVYYDFKAAVEKAKAAMPDYIYQSPEKPDLLTEYAALKETRHL